LIAVQMTLRQLTLVTVYPRPCICEYVGEVSIVSIGVDPGGTQGTRPPTFRIRATPVYYVTPIVPHTAKIPPPLSAPDLRPWQWVIYCNTV